MTRTRTQPMTPLTMTHGLAIAGLALMALGGTAPPAAAQQDGKVTIRFAAQVGDKPFACGDSYDGIGTTRSRVTPSDFRFYVSDVQLVDANGKSVPLALQQDGRWQHANVALLDFENRTGPCLTGTNETRDVIVGTAPAGDY